MLGALDKRKKVGLSEVVRGEVGGWVGGWRKDMGRWVGGWVGGRVNLVETLVDAAVFPSAQASVHDSIGREEDEEASRNEAGEANECLA